MSLDPANPVFALCIEGTRAEFAGQPLVAAALYQRAWELASDDLEACVAAHYHARFQPTPAVALRWHQQALARARSAGEDMTREFLPSLYLSLGQAYEQTGSPEEARRYYDLAADLGYPHQEG